MSLSSSLIHSLPLHPQSPSVAPAGLSVSVVSLSLPALPACLPQSPPTSVVVVVACLLASASAELSRGRAQETAVRRQISETGRGVTRGGERSHVVW